MCFRENQTKTPDAVLPLVPVLHVKRSSGSSNVTDVADVTDASYLSLLIGQQDRNAELAGQRDGLIDFTFQTGNYSSNMNFSPHV